MNSRALGRNFGKDRLFIRDLELRKAVDFDDELDWCESKDGKLEYD
jgi:hypothetical protein